MCSRAHRSSAGDLLRGFTETDYYSVPSEEPIRQRLRVVFDSNVLISGLLFPGRQAEKALLRITAGRDQLLLSKDIIDEVVRVLARKFARDAELARAALLLADLGELIRPKTAAESAARRSR